MLFQTAALLILSAIPALAAPNPVDVSARATWLPNKCDSNIRITRAGAGKWPHWYISTATPGPKDAGDGDGQTLWEGETRYVHAITIRHTGLSIAVNSQTLSGHDSLTLRYGSQEWNSKDCYKFSQKGDTFEWFCQYDCPMPVLPSPSLTSSGAGPERTN